ncbi:hypothetical protein BGZ46_010726, partial [Entomortierella lignicola]
PGDCPPAKEMRHHRRSVDRVWPPALEVKLARIMLDDAPYTTTRRPYIIPPPPPISQYHDLLEQEKIPSPSISSEHFVGHIREIPFETQSAPSTPSSIRPMFYVSEKKRNSILGPLSPSSNAETDRHLFRHGSLPPRIDVKYHRNCKSIPRLQRNNTFSGYGEDYISLRDKSNVDGSDVNWHRRYSISPSPTIQRSGYDFYNGEHPTTMIKEEKEQEEAATEEEFGKDLFGNYSKFEQQLVSSAEAKQMTLKMPSISKIRHSSQVESSKGSLLDNKESLKQGVKDGKSSTNALDQDLPSLFQNSRPSISPGRKNPLSASPSPVPSRVSSRPSSCAHGQFRVSSSLQENDVEMKVDQPNSGRLESPVHVLESQRENAKEGELPVESEISSTLPDVVSNDQVRWRSPALVAQNCLSTPTAALGPGSISSTAFSSPNCENNTTITSSNGNYVLGGSLDRQRPKNYISVEADLTADIPLIESHDEISLQDIWKMEEEERRYRSNFEDDEYRWTHGHNVNNSNIHSNNIGEMRGERHAHEEARLIRELLVSERQQV